ncbi:LytTR family DNA-binding domain-containing protein [Brevibacillus humidisoli]|uniref:LytR/AlgR family response regulator transcription factor n=1 Tax=Brevibacillus humidisoli TaxID=2895522 RepID=UPI001E3A6528|nr:LytTR family DNA-binding domain-containing protein [Brevibacillus humidisoli]UFJ41165.1 LytTR family DNA-binding domain-containing protein [Brevibacillus humidisoli]
MIRVVIIDDELYSRDELKHLLQEYRDIQVVGEADTGVRGLEIVMTEEPDVIFVDIEMPEMTGVSMVEAIQKLKKVPVIVFATAYPDYAVKAFRLQALDYLLKPFDEEQVADTVDRIRSALAAARPTATHGERKQEPSVGKLAVEDGDGIVYLAPQEILFVGCENKTTYIYTKDRQYTYRGTLKETEQKLSGYPFCRTHKSYLVNLDAVEQLIPWFHGAYTIKLVGCREKIPVSRNYVKTLRERLEL